MNPRMFTFNEDYHHGIDPDCFFIETDDDGKFIPALSDFIPTFDRLIFDFEASKIFIEESKRIQSSYIPLKKTRNKYAKTYRDKYPIKDRAKDKLNYHVRKHKIVKPTICSNCHEEVKSSRSMHAHHEDYSQPLNVKWLCKKCHQEAHKRTW